MYPPNQSKVPPVRPRSSLSTDEHHRIKDVHRRHAHRHRRQHNNALLTLVGFCIFLFVLCIFLLGALIYVGRTIAVADKHTNTTEQILTDELGNSFHVESFHNSTRPILRLTTFLPPVTPTNGSTKLLPRNMAASRILQKLTYRLPSDYLKPLHYLLRLQPDLKNKTFSGNVTIRVEVLQPIDFIPIHAKRLQVSTLHVMQLKESGDSEITPESTFEHPEFEYWVTAFTQPLDVGNYTIKLAFNGSLTDRIVGFYQSSYLKTDAERSELRWIATSKFEPTYARQAFPCFDEPAMKAKFSISILRPTGDGYHALSNMNVENEKVVGDITEVNFAESVLMSTYLVCFIVSDFAHKTKTVKGILNDAKDFEMRVFATSAQVEKVQYALDTGAAITEHYIDYFNIAYPLPKLDMAAIPDFVSGAMEHWGLVTYRETALLYDETISSSANKQRVATVIAHELAHMWFGNLVTMKWWNDLWLNEGFASYIEYKGVNKVHPEWQMLDQFLISDLHGVMKRDATLASHPIVQIVNSPNEITELFDSITYSKGASVIRMLEDLVGADKFRNATHQYLSKYRYKNAETDDFLTEVEAQDFDFDVKLIMQTWTEQMGLPVVDVEPLDNDELTYKLKQRRFFANPEDYNNTYTDSNFNYHWTIPITYYTSGDSTVKRVLFNYNDNEVTISVPSSVDWIKFNKNQVGYYRVNYPSIMWRKLILALNSNRGQFSVADRAHLVSDAFALADASQLKYDVALDLTTYLKNELDYIPWNVASSHLSAIRHLLYFTDLYKNFAVYVRDLVSQAYELVTWNVGQDHLQNLLRVTILNTACAFGHEGALQEAAKQFTEWIDNPSVRPKPDIRSTVYYYGMQAVGNEQSWDKVWQLFISEQDAQEKVKLMESLAAIKEPWILQRYINFAWNESYVRGQDYFTCLQYISQNRIGQSLVWDYVRDNWQRMVDRFGINERYLGRLIPGITSRFASKTKLEEMKIFFEKYPEAGAGTAARKEALVIVKNNIQWLEVNKWQIGTWLREREKKLKRQ